MRGKELWGHVVTHQECQHGLKKFFGSPAESLGAFPSQMLECLWYICCSKGGNHTGRIGDIVSNYACGWRNTTATDPVP